MPVLGCLDEGSEQPPQGAGLHHVVEKSFTCLGYRFLSFSYAAAIEIYPRMLLFKQCCICGKLHRGSRSAEGGSAPCSKEDNVGARRSKIRRGNEIIAGTGEKIKALFLNGAGIFLHIDYLCRSALLDAAQDRKSTRLNSSHPTTSRMPSSA